MDDKIWDIVPPKTPSPSSKGEEPKVEYKRTNEEEERERLPKETKVNFGWVLILLFLILAFVVGFKMSKAEIKIWPETETIFLKKEITVDTKIQNSDFKNETIPGQLLTIEESLLESFTSSGKTQKEAEGVIRLYNEYTTKSETWREGTRFVSSEGKLFKSKDNIAVPGADIEGGKLAPNYVDVPVIAAEAGEDYNIGPSNFSIFVYRGTEKYTKYYGKSLESMKGGGDSTQVTAEDISDAQEIITEKAKAKAIASLKAKVANEFVFLDDILETEVTDIFSLAKEGDEVEKFNCRAVVKATTIVFKRAQVYSLVKSFISSKTPEGRLVYEKSLKIDYTPRVVDFESERTVISLSFSVKIYPEIDLQLLKKSLIGKSLEETKIFLERQSEFTDTKKPEIKFWPFWVKSVPQDLNKIEIEYPLID